MKTTIKKSLASALAVLMTTSALLTAATAARADDIVRLDAAIIDNGTPPNTNATLFADFRTGQLSQHFYPANGWTNGFPFDCVWRADNVFIADNAMNLRIDTDSSSEHTYSAGEYRSVEYYHYGYYEVSMKPIKNIGVVSSFFTYTGPYDNDPWDEIDIEFVGKDTTRVQFNYYTDGKGGNEFMYELGFDASESFNTYGFDWQPDKITWYVNGVEVHSATENLPVTPGKIMMNVWPGTGVDGWLGRYDGTTPLTAEYQWLTYNKDGPPVPDRVDCDNCDKCKPEVAPNAGKLGYVLGNATVGTSDALEILKYIVKLPTPINTCNNAKKAATIMGSSITTADALEILKHIVKLPNKIDGNA